MGFHSGAYARVWKLAENKGNYSTVQMSISSKNRETGQYETVWQDGFTRFVGAAHNKLAKMNIPDGGLTIYLTATDVNQNYVKEKKTMYTNYVVFDFIVPESGERYEMVCQKAGGGVVKDEPPKAEEKKDNFASVTEDEDLPF